MGALAHALLGLVAQASCAQAQRVLMPKARCRVVGPSMVGARWAAVVTTPLQWQPEVLVAASVVVWTGLRVKRTLSLLPVALCMYIVPQMGHVASSWCHQRPNHAHQQDRDTHGRLTQLPPASQQTPRCASAPSLSVERRRDQPGPRHHLHKPLGRKRFVQSMLGLLQVPQIDQVALHRFRVAMTMARKSQAMIALVWKLS